MPPARDEISSLGNTLNAMLARIDRAFERERAFTSDASHELRTPLSILKTEVDLALEGGRSRAELVAALESVSEETDRLSRLAEDLLVLARADEGRLPLSVEPLELGALAQRVGGRFAARAAAEGRSLRVADGDDVRLRADPLRLDQALTNLIDNALRYGAGDVGVRASRRDGRAELHVTDDGAGLPPELGERAFDRFARADAEAPAPAPGSASRSSPRSPARTAAASTPRRRPRAAPTSGSRCPPPTNRPLIAPREAGLQMVNHHHGGAS